MDGKKGLRMERFSNKATSCPKCGGINFTLKHHYSSITTLHPNLAEDHETEEYLKIACNICNYEWKEACVDAED